MTPGRVSLVGLCALGWAAACGGGDSSGARPRSVAEEGGTGGAGTGGKGGTDTGGKAGAATGGAGGEVGTGGVPGTGGAGNGGRELPADAAAPLEAGTSAPDASPPGAGLEGCVLKWSPSAGRDGNGAFEGLEMPDGRGTHPGVMHFYVVTEHDAYRVDQHNEPGAVDLDNHPDRLRCEVKGMRTGGTNLALVPGQRWRISWSFFLPATMEATGSFSDIFQMKYVDTGGASSGSPVFTINLPRPGGVEKLVAQAQFAPGLGGFPALDLVPLREKWVSTTFDFTVGAGAAGKLRWIVSDGARTLVDVEKQVPTWPSDAARLRPKWGLYRKLGDPHVRTTHMLIADLRAWLCQ